jgi:hypothetical protein
MERGDQKVDDFEEKFDKLLGILSKEGKELEEFLKHRNFEDSHKYVETLVGELDFEKYRKRIHQIAGSRKLVVDEALKDIAGGKSSLSASSSLIDFGSSVFNLFFDSLFQSEQRARFYRIN